MVDRTRDERIDDADVRLSGGEALASAVSDMTIAQIRDFVAGAHLEPGDALWEALAGDSRAGVRSLIESEIRRRARASRERARLEALRRHERELWATGCVRVAGVDEVGRGPLAGPVVAAAVILGEESIPGVNDSKKLTPRRREALHPVILERAVSVGIGRVPQTTIDSINILQASRQAMRIAIAALETPPDHVLVDGVEVPEMPCPQTAIPGGDGISAPIAAASIVAKVTRDREMVEMDERYPGYGFARHKGYGTEEHLAALTRLGPCEIHRQSFDVVREAAGGLSPAYQRFRRLLTAASDADTLEEIGASIKASSTELSEYELSRLRALYRRSHVRVRAGVGIRRD